ncbi:T9SS type A sorting domain-containing protein [Bacteroidales bacterium OttesenSCG-928-I21]|nr:T9SS type A sorting domain-containing protein [Bacteroidales bacterium OttesenSCG-928-I21]
MKKPQFTHKLRASFLIALSCLFVHTQAQVQIYYEDFGSPTEKSTALASYTGWREKNVTYSKEIKGNQDVDIRNNQESKYSDGNPSASRDGNVYLNGGPVSFVVKGINTSEYYNLGLSFGVFGKTANAIQSFTVEYSTNNGTSYQKLASFETSTNEEKEWQYIANIPGLPQSASLCLRFSTTKNIKIRLDDILITGTETNSPVPSISVEANLVRFETSPTVTSQSQTIKISGENIQDGKNITLSLPDNSPFILSQNIIPKSELPKNITITYSPAKVGYNVDTLYLTTDGLSDRNRTMVRLQGKCNFLQPNNLTANKNSGALALQWSGVTGGETYLVNITKEEGTGVEEVIFSETFNKMKDTEFEDKELLLGDRIDGLASPYPTSVSYFMDNSSGWKGTYVYLGSDDDLGEKEGVVRIGKKDGGKGFLYTPKIDLSGNDVYLKVKIRSFSKSGQSEENKMKISHFTDERNVKAIATVENLYPDFYEYTFKITDGVAGSTIRFESDINNGAAANNRFILDDLQVVRGGKQTSYVALNQLVDGTSFDLSSLDADETYTATVYAYDANAVFASPVSNTYIFKPSDFNGSGLAEIENIQVYMFGDELYVDLKNDMPINIYNVLGQQLFTKQGKTGQNIISGLTAGQVYIVKIENASFKIIW